MSAVADTIAVATCDPCWTNYNFSLINLVGVYRRVRIGRFAVRARHAVARTIAANRTGGKFGRSRRNMGSNNGPAQKALILLLSMGLSKVVWRLRVQREARGLSDHPP